uniref:TP53-binding protein 1 isoform X3 n=1 Tax=Monopterus albus TaxID=43700 RepID=UPI0009B361BE|nr:tumor suppressor p53-binding protein 1 isoform X3 [Monopterus albus]
MDPGGNELDSSLPQPDNPCLIVEDSQPDSVALEDDPESSYRALLARRLSSLQPPACSPVLGNMERLDEGQNTRKELISSPLGSRCSQTDSQSESSQSNNQAEPGVLMTANPSSAFEEESQVINICPSPNKNKCAQEDTDMNSGADSTTHCIQSEGESSQPGFLKLSQSQDLCGEAVNSQEEEEDIVLQPDSERCSKSADHRVSCRTSARQDSTSVRSEVSSSSSLDSLGQSGRQLNVQALVHSQGRQASSEQDQQDCEILSSQEDLFDVDKTAAAVDSTVSEPEQQGHPTPTPARTLRLLHLSGQGTLGQDSLSQSSVGYVAPSPDNVTHTPLIIPSSPTGPEIAHGVEEPMDTSFTPEDQAGEKEEEPMETDGASKPHPSASTPVSQYSPGFVVECALPLPSQPELSHDLFVPTQSLEAHSDKKTASSSHETQSQHLESAPFALPLQLSINTESCSPAQQMSKQPEDSEATQIEELEEPPGADTSDSVSSCCSQRRESNGVPSEAQTATSSKASTSAESPKHRSTSAKIEQSNLSQKSDEQKNTTASLNVQAVNVKDSRRVEASSDTVSCSQTKFDSSNLTVNSCVQETPSDTAACSLPSQSMISHTTVVKSSVDVRGAGTAESQPVESLSQQCATVGNSQTDKDMMDEHEQGELEEEVVVMEEAEGESSGGDRTSGLALVLSQSHLLSPEPMEEESEDQGADSIIVVTDSEKDTRILPTDAAQLSVTNKVSASTNGHESQPVDKEVNAAPDRLSQTERPRPETEGLKDKSLSDSSGEISFHFTLPKEGELIGPPAGATPPLINQLKQTLRHSTPIEIPSFSEKPDVVGDVSADVAIATASDIVSGESGEDVTDKGDGKLSLRMKLVTPVEEGSSERFSLQKPALSEDDGSVVKVTTVSKAVASPSVFTRVRQVHRQQEAEEDSQLGGNTTPVRGELFASPQRNSQGSSLGCSSLPNSQSEPPHQQILAAPQQKPKDPPTPAEQPDNRGGPAEAAEPPAPNRTDTRQKVVSQETFDSTVTSSPSNRLHQRTVSQQTSFDAQGLRSPAGRGEPESPSFRRIAGPAHRRHVRTIQEVRTTVTRIITDVYYEDGKEVERKVAEESEEPVVECQVLDSDISPCRTGSSSVTSGDLGDISSLSSKASSLQHSSGGTSSSTVLTRPDFIVPPSRGAKTPSPRRGGGHQQRGHRGHRAGSVITKDRTYSTLGSRAFVPLIPRGRARRGRPPSRSFPSRGGGAGSLQRLGAYGQLQSSSEDEPYTRMLPPRLPVSPTELPSHSDSLRTSPEEASLAGSSFVGLRVVAKWSSNGYFYSGRIIKDAGQGRFRLRFDDGYECEVAGKDILLCDPIPLDTEVTALLEDEYFSIGVVRGHKTEGQELFYNVEREGQRQWYNRTSVILSLEQGNRLREQHSLGPDETSTPLAKASDISLDNLVEGKRRRRGTPGGQNTPNRSSSSSSPRTPGPSGKRKLMTSENDRTPAKRGRRGPGARAAQRVGVCNTSSSGTDLPGQSCDTAESHGPLPQNTSLFMGFAFMLTGSSESDRLTNKLTSDDEEAEYVQTGPYNKTYTESQLQAGGGFILPDFNEEQCKAAYQSLLIADQHCRTRKYLLCLASGVPCVSHIWVRDCCKENKLLNYRNYLLPAGVGPDDAIVEWHPRCSPFKALRILLVFEKPVELWAQLITMGGGSSVRHFQADKDTADIPPGKYDVVVTDHACPPLVEKGAASQEVPLVSPEWLIQSLICGERLGFCSKPEYCHDYST